MSTRIWVLTLFPQFFQTYFKCGIISKISQEIKLINLADCSLKSFKGVDDSPYGGGQGMIIKAPVLKNGLEKIRSQTTKKLKVIFTSPRGDTWNHQIAREFSANFSQDQFDLVFISGRYEGIDERFIQRYVDEIYSVGDFVLMGGELAIALIIESSSRYIPGLLGDQMSAEDDSFESGLIEFPQYTRPQSFEGLDVPEILLSGDHKKISKFRLEESKKLTKSKRPDLWKRYEK